jgi:hypothetical protein
MRGPQPRERAYLRLLDAHLEYDADVVAPTHCAVEVDVRVGTVECELVDDDLAFVSKQARIEQSGVNADIFLSRALRRDHGWRFQAQRDRPRPIQARRIGNGSRPLRRARVADDGHVETAGLEHKRRDCDLARGSVPNRDAGDLFDHHRLVIRLVEAEIAPADLHLTRRFENLVARTERESQVEGERRVGVEAGRAEAAGKRNLVDRKIAKLRVEIAPSPRRALRDGDGRPTP